MVVRTARVLLFSAAILAGCGSDSEDSLPPDMGTDQPIVDAGTDVGEDLSSDASDNGDMEEFTLYEEELENLQSCDEKCAARGLSCVVVPKGALGLIDTAGRVEWGDGKSWGTLACDSVPKAETRDIVTGELLPITRFACYCE